MAINFKKYVKIVSGVGGAAAASRRDLGLRVFTTNPVLTYDQVVVCTTADDVMALFGDSSEEYGIAANYFGYISNSITQAKQISFVRWLKTSPVYMTSITGNKTPLDISSFTGTIGLKFQLGTGSSASVAEVDVEIGENEVAADYEDVAERFTKALICKSQSDTTYGWLKSASCEYSGGVFVLTFTNHASSASAGPSVSLIATTNSDVTDARRIMGLRKFNVWEPLKWATFAKDDIPSWVASTAYAVGDFAKVTVGSTTTYYYCKEANSDETFTVSKWIALSNVDTTTEWSDTTAYSVGDCIVYSGATYVCLTAISAPASSEDPTTDNALTHAIESPKAAVSRVCANDDNFGSFCFVEEITDGQKKGVAQWNKGQNYKYMFLTYALKGLYSVTASELNGYECTAVTYENRHGEYAEFMPAALFAATDYTRVNSTKTFMYKQFPGVNPSVGLKSDMSPKGGYANLYQDLDAKRINYYGQTMKSGKPLCFYQDGNCMDGTEISVACNEIWMKDAIETEIINLLIAMEKVPANTNGIEMINMMINGVVGEALNNGTISKEKTLTNVQKVYIDTVSGEKDAWKYVYSNGYWLNTVLKQDNSTGTTVYKADYTLIYSKGDSIRKVTGSDIMI